MSLSKWLTFLLSVLLSAFFVVVMDWCLPSEAQVACGDVQAQTQAQCDAANAYLTVANSHGNPLPTTVDTVVTANNYALLGWQLGESGGVAILKQMSGTWQLVRGVGGTFSSAADLLRFGVPAETATALWDLWSQANAAPQPTP